jgi:uncharacterized protein
MLLVRTRIQPSNINGLGLFADEFIPKGTRILQYEPAFDRAYTDNEIQHLPQTVQEYLHHYSYFSTDLKKWILPFDNDRYVNHSNNPNTRVEPTLVSHGESGVIALRDIYPGEEITLNYKDMEGEQHARERKDMQQELKVA